jgi:hypothetical protein
MESCGTGTCLCSGNTVESTNELVLQETTVDFYKVKQDEYIHYCFDGIELQKEEILQNIAIGQTLLQKQDRLVVASKESLQPFLQLKNGCISKECFLEDNSFYTVIFYQ